MPHVDPIPAPPTSAPQTGIWQHYKGTTYRVLGLCWLTENQCWAVRYERLDARHERGGTGSVEFVRPLSQWTEEIAPGARRFTPVYMAPTPR
jgi:hypothetical protein